MIEAKQKEAALAAAQKSERDATDQLFLALLNQARAGRFSRQMGQRLDSLAALARAARHPPRRAAARRGHRRDGPARPPTRARLALLAPRHDDGRVRRAVPALRPSRHPRGSSASAASPTTRRSGASPRARSRGSPVLQPRRPFLLGLGEASHAARVARGRRAAGPPGRAPRVPRAMRSARTAGLWRSASKSGSSASIWRRVGKFGAGGCPIAVTRTGISPGQPQTGRRVPLFPTSFPSTTRRAGPSSRTCPSVTMSNQVVAWHPDGERLAVAGSDPRIQIWNVAAKRKVATLEGHAQNVTDADVSPRGRPPGLPRLGRHVAACGNPSTGRQLMRSDLRQRPSCDSAPTADGSGVTQHGERADLLEVTPNREYRTLVSSGVPERAVMATATSARMVACWPWAWTKAPVCGTCAAAGS